MVEVFGIEMVGLAAVLNSVKGLEDRGLAFGRVSIVFQKLRRIGLNQIVQSFSSNLLINLLQFFVVLRMDLKSEALKLKIR